MAAGESGEGAVLPDGVERRVWGGLRPCLHRAECAIILLSGGVDLSVTEFCSRERFHAPPPVSPPSGFRLRPLPVLRD